MSHVVRVFADSGVVDVDVDTAANAAVDADGRAWGGKARGLFRLCAVGERVPEFFIVAADADIDVHVDALVAAARAVAGAGGTVAVRSSADVEDGVAVSYAGQFATLLDVPVHGDGAALRAAIAACRASASAAHVAAYAAHAAAPRAPVAVEDDDAADDAAADAAAAAAASAAIVQPHNADAAHARQVPPLVHCVVQRMVPARTAGVCFTSDPAGARDEVVIVAAPGLGTGVVDGTADALTVTKKNATAPWQHVSGPRAVLSAAESDAVCALAQRVAARFGHDVDLEWAIDGDGALFALQARPITTLPDGAVSYFDRSNVGENYPGLTLPLTMSHLVESYEHVFRNLLLRLGVDRRRLQREDAALRSLLGHIDGRVAYNTAQWYRLLRLVPGIDPYLVTWREMLGVDADGDADGVRLRGVWGIARTAWRALVHLVRLDADHRAFLAAFDDAYAAYQDTTRAPADAHTLIGLYRGLNAQLLDGWEITLLNDGFAFLFSSVAKRLLRRAGGSDDTFFGLLADDPQLESIAPLKALLALGARLRNEPALSATRTRLRAAAEGKAPPSSWRTPIAAAHADTNAERAAHERFVVDVDAYLAAYGDRCADELKLESRTFNDDALAFARALVAAADSGRDVVDDATAPPTPPPPPPRAPRCARTRCCASVCGSRRRSRVARSAGAKQAACGARGPTVPCARSSRHSGTSSPPLAPSTTPAMFSSSPRATSLAT